MEISEQRPTDPCGVIENTLKRSGSAQLTEANVDVGGTKYFSVSPAGVELQETSGGTASFTFAASA